MTEYNGTSFYYTRCIRNTHLSLYRLRPLVHVFAVQTIDTSIQTDVTSLTLLVSLA
jgi:hypothetical protein